MSFVGTLAIADRLKFLQFLREGRIPFEVHGEGAGGYVTFDRMLNIFQSSKINLSFSKGGGYYLVRQIKGRVFQVCLAGGFLLTENSPGIDGYFDVGKEIVCFDTPEEMVDKIRYYLEHDGERRAIARAGWERASREYTSSHLVNRAFEEIERRWVGDGWQRRSASKLAMPRLVRRFPADYHLCWAKAYLEEGADDGLWRESRDTSLRWNRLNPWVAYFWFASLFPQPIRRCLCRWQDYEWRTRVRVLRRLQKINLVRVVADRVFRRLW